jgi:fumarate hydratase class II
MNFLAAKVKDALFKAAEDKIEAEILKSMGEVKVTIGDINKKVDKLEGGQAQIAAQVSDTVSYEITG